ncbi:MAG: circadian clock protein KaiC [Candidatus Lokiarchaeota archaeon]|nr:circadian clock protein KaiC [Candidatus Lokiarchaeota archaeon]MBD3202452.1 circadian clock protein KaiC [Candidatus Lokiarchaeota archaeon]
MNNKNHVGIEKIKTGIEGFDILSKGGIPRNRTTLISGTPGSGKTIFSTEFLAKGILKSNQTGVFVTFEELPKNIKKNVRSFGWPIDKWEYNKKWAFIDGSPRNDKNVIYGGDFNLNGLIARIKAKIKEIRASRVVIDSLDTMMKRFPSEEVVRRDLLKLKRELEKLDVTTIITSERYEEFGNISRYDLEEFVSDNVLILRNVLNDETRRRTIEILKFRGTDHNKGQYSYTIRKDKGIVIISFIHDLKSSYYSSERSNSGIMELDHMLGGGFLSGSVILVSGSTGTGKTLIGISFIIGGLKESEKCLLISFEENYKSILNKTKYWNYGLDKYEDSGQLEILNIYPEIEGIEDHIVDIKEKIDTFKPNRIVIDSISALERICDVRSFRESLINLFIYIRTKNIIGLFTSTSPTFMGLTTITQRHISTITDTIILLRYIELYGEVKRGISVIKMRDSNHSKKIREFVITEKGLKIKEPFNNVSGVLKGDIIKGGK